MLSYSGTRPTGKDMENLSKRWRMMYCKENIHSWREYL